jgi:hypothetical protein
MAGQFVIFGCLCLLSWRRYVKVVEVFFSGLIDESGETVQWAGAFMFLIYQSIISC